MRLMLILACGLVLSLGAAQAEESDDPVLDARLNVFTLGLTYTEHHPKMIEAQYQLDALTKIYTETRAEYRAHLQERLKKAEVEVAVLKQTYTDKHPLMVEANARLKFLQEEIRKTRRHTS